MIGITIKDLYHRLLSCIPKGHTNCMLNGKKVRLAIAHFETEADKLANQGTQKKMNELPPQKWQGWSTGMECRIAHKEYSGRVLQNELFFECDAPHHEAVAKKYAQLINPFIPEPSYATNNGIPMPENPEDFMRTCLLS